MTRARRVCERQVTSFVSNKCCLNNVLSETFHAIKSCFVSPHIIGVFRTTLLRKQLANVNMHTTYSLCSRTAAWATMKQGALATLPELSTIADHSPMEKKHGYFKFFFFSMNRAVMHKLHVTPPYSELKHSFQLRVI